mgnify:CR=1 FL=1
MKEAQIAYNKWVEEFYSELMDLFEYVIEHCRFQGPEFAGKFQRFLILRNEIQSLEQNCVKAEKERKL